MSVEDEVLRIGRKLERHKDNPERLMDLLRALTEQDVTLGLLESTRIGMTVNLVRKQCDSDKVNSAARNLIKSWKRLLSKTDSSSRESKPADNNPNSGEQSKEVVEQTTEEVNDEVHSVNGEGSNSGPEGSGPNPGSNSGPEGSGPNPGLNSGPEDSGFNPGSNQGSGCQLGEPTNTKDSLRLKCRQLLANSLRANLDEEPTEVDNLAGHIEDAIFNLHGSQTNTKYKNRVRSRVANLSDPKNPGLKRNVLWGIILPDKLAAMSSEELASAEMARLRAQYTKDGINDHQMAVTEGTKTNLLKCPRCRGNETTYNQMQTRSADEPMTTFCFCNHCGYRWKFC